MQHRPRVFLRPGSGKITVNGRPFDEYFPTDAGRIPAKFPHDRGGNGRSF